MDNIINSIKRAMKGIRPSEMRDQSELQIGCGARENALDLINLLQPPHTSSYAVPSIDRHINYVGAQEPSHVSDKDDAFPHFLCVIHVQSIREEIPRFIGYGANRMPEKLRLEAVGWIF